MWVFTGLTSSIEPANLKLEEGGGQVDNRSISQLLLGISLAAVVLSGYGFLVGDIWLASTQWLLIATIMGIYSLWLKVK